VCREFYSLLSSTYQGDCFTLQAFPSNLGRLLYGTNRREANKIKSCDAVKAKPTSSFNREKEETTIYSS